MRIISYDDYGNELKYICLLNFCKWIFYRQTFHLNLTFVRCQEI